MELKVQVVEDFEIRMGLEERWTTTHPKRIQAQSRISNALYHKAVDDVERLVVMRLLELTKLQMSGLGKLRNISLFWPDIYYTGYKLRTQIAKALKTRATAIRNALNRYNKYAAELDPPRAPITWDQVVEFSQLSEFDLLRDTENQLLDKRWAVPRNRQASAKYFDMQRAKEEIVRCNVEILRLRTKIRDDAVHFPVVIAQLHTSNAPLAAEVQRHWDYLRSINSFHLSRIAQIEALPGYSGSRAAGIRQGYMDTSVPPERQCEDGDVQVNGGEVDDDVVDDDPDGEQQTLMEDFFDRLHNGPAGMDEE